MFLAIALLKARYHRAYDAATGVTEEDMPGEDMPSLLRELLAVVQELVPSGRCLLFVEDLLAVRGIGRGKKCEAACTVCEG